MFVGINLGINLRSSVSFSPSALFAAGEPGVWFDPSDVANLSWLVNLFTYSQEFNEASWQKSNVTVSQDVGVAPDGTTTADKLVGTAFTGQCQLFRNLEFVDNQNYSLSFFVKAAEATWAVISIQNQANVYFRQWVNLSTGQAGTGTGSVVPAGNGWYRVSVSANSSSGAQTERAYIQPVDADNTTTFTGNGTSGILIWGAQLEAGPVATTYQPITTVNAGTIERFPNATLYQDSIGTTLVNTPGQAVGLMLDKSKGLVRTTLATLPLNTAPWTSFGGGTVTSNTVTATAGGQGVQRSVVAGRWYRITSNVASIVGTISYVAEGSGTVYGGIVAGEATRVFNATSNGFLIYSSSAGSVAFNSITLEEIPGNHAFQNTPAARPTYAIEPAGGRRNILTFSQDFESAAWAASDARITSNSVVAPDGTMTADHLIEQVPQGSGHYILQTFGLPSGSYTFSGYFRPGGRSKIMLYFATVNKGRGFDLSNGTTFAIAGVPDADGYGVVSVGGGWYRCFISSTTGTISSARMYLVDAANNFLYVGDNVSGVYVWGTQYETGSTATPYQKVTTQYDVTQAGKASMSYLYFDGVNDAMATSTITPGIDKAQVFTGVRKLGNIPAPVMESSVNFGSNNGAIALFAPSGTGNDYYYGTTGTFVVGINSGAGSYVAPITNIVTGLSNIAGPISSLRVNGTQVTQSVASQGTGNYLAYPIYIGARGGTASFFSGHIYSLITRFGTTLPDSTITNTERWVAGETGFYPPIITGVPTIGVS